MFNVPTEMKFKSNLNKKFKNYNPSKIKNKGCKGIHGDRECERRKRQIAYGQLKLENGLDLSFIPQYKFK